MAPRHTDCSVVRIQYSPVSPGCGLVLLLLIDDVDQRLIAGEADEVFLVQREIARVLAVRPPRDVGRDDHIFKLPERMALRKWLRVRHVHTRARQMLRGVAADIVCTTEEPFIQVIYDLHVPSYLHGHICLVGDASSIARPHTGAGAIKAQQQAIALSNALSEHDSLDAALETWNDEVWSAGDAQVNLGKVLGRALVTEAPPWETMDKEGMEQWWKDATSGMYVYYFDDAMDETETA